MSIRTCIFPYAHLCSIFIHIHLHLCTPPTMYICIYWYTINKYIAACVWNINTMNAQVQLYFKGRAIIKSILNKGTAILKKQIHPQAKTQKTNHFPPSLKNWEIQEPSAHSCERTCAPFRLLPSLQEFSIEERMRKARRWVSGLCIRALKNTKHEYAHNDCTHIQHIFMHIYCFQTGASNSAAQQMYIEHAFFS